MDPQQLRYFLALASAQSFVKAAEVEGVTQPSLSQQIKRLETDLGVPLFDRLGRGVQLTPYGKALLPLAESMLRQAGEARKAIASLNSLDEGKVSVGVIPTILPYGLAEPLNAFRTLYPGVEIDLQEQTTERLIESLRRGALDVAVLALPIKHPEIVCSDLFREPLLAAVPLDHPLASQTVIDIKQLSAERMLLLREGHCLRDHVLTACTRAKTEFSSVFESDHLGSILSLVASGFGVSLIPQLAGRQAVGCALIPVRPQAFRRVGYAMAAGHVLLPAQKNFISHLRKYAWPKS